MPDILVRGIDEKTLRRLKARARRHGTSLQGEARLLLERGAGAGRAEVAALLKKWSARFAGRRFVSSARLIREDRDR